MTRISSRLITLGHLQSVMKTHAQLFICGNSHSCRPCVHNLAFKKPKGRLW